MKKILILNHGLASGGTDTFTINVAKGLQQRGYAVTVALAVDPDSEPQTREDVLTSAGIPIVKTADLADVRGMLRHAKRLYRLLKDGRFDVLHANMDLFNGVNMAVAFFAGVKVRVCHSHNSQSQYEANTGKHLAVNAYRTLMRILCRVFSNRRCGCSAEAMAYLFGKKWGSLQHSCVIFNGIDLSRFSQKAERPADGTHRIVTVGRLAEQKNPLFLVKIIEALAKRRTDFELLWVGDGELRAQVEQAIGETQTAPYIRLLGVRNDVETVLGQSEVFVFPSLFEGLGIVLVEAQAVGLYTLVSDTVPPLADCGLCDFLPIDDPAVWADRLSDFFDRGTTKTVDPARLRKFSAEHMIDQLEDVYRA